MPFKFASVRSMPIPTQRSFLAAAAFLGPLALSLLLHWRLLGYRQPYGGQQSDDDYHYYGFAARLGAEHPLDLPAFRTPAAPDRLTDLYDQARVSISFSNAWPYPGWSLLMHGLVAGLGLGYPAASFALFALQSALFVGGAQLLAAAALPGSPSALRGLLAGATAALFPGVDGIPSPLLSIPMNLAAAFALCSLGLLASGRRRLGAGCLLAAAGTHVAAALLAAYVVCAWASYELWKDPGRPVILQALAMGAATLGAWTLVYHGFLGIGAGRISEGIELGWDRSRWALLLGGYGRFFPLTVGAGALACFFASRHGEGEWRLPAACLAALAVLGAGFVLVGNRHHGHPTLLPFGRMLYLAPFAAFLASLLASAASLARRAAVPVRLAALACALLPAAAAARQGGLVLEHQFAARPDTGLGPLYERMGRFAAETALPRTAFVFARHEFGTVLGAARLYPARFLWAKIYSPERLEAAAADRERLVLLDDPEDPPLRVGGFCEASRETVPIGYDPGRTGARAVRLSVALRCPPSRRHRQ